MRRWKKIDLNQQQVPYYLNKDQDQCYYAHEYFSGGDYTQGGNSLIYNFKKAPQKRGTLEWLHKKKAIKKFANEVARVFEGKEGIHVSTIPTSKTRNHIDYDDRFDQFSRELKKINPRLIIERPIERMISVEPAHGGQGTRDPLQIIQSLGWQGFSSLKAPGRLYVIDDVLTTVSHFRAYKTLISKNSPGIEVIGMFWALVNRSEPHRG